MRRLLTSLAVVLLSASASRHATAGLVWPDVPERVERGLKSPDPSTRRVAARDLASLNNARATPLVLSALSDPDVEVRLAAAQSAIRLHVTAATEVAILWLSERETRLRVSACEVAHAMPNPKVVQALARALGDPDPQVRAAGADALGSSGSPDAVAPLAGKLDDGTPNVRAQVARALARLGDSRAVVPLVGKVQDSVPEVRQAVVRALGDLGDTHATQALLLALRDNVPEVKVEALAALGRLRAPEAVDAIAPLALDRNPSVRQAAIVSLGRTATPAAVRALIKTLGTQEDASASLDRTPVRDALVVSGPAAVTELTALLERPISAAVATSAAWVLGELRSFKSAPILVSALRRGSLPAPAALRALAGAGTAAEVPIVLEFVSDPSPATREQALSAAAALLDPSHPDGRAVEPLAAALKNPRTSPLERAAVAALLGRTGAPRATAELVGLVSSKDEGLKLAAIDALGALGAGDNGAPAEPLGREASDDVLVPLLADTNSTVRLRAAVALGASGGPKAKRALLAKLDGGEELDRFALFTALGGILERIPDDASGRRVLHELNIAAGPERDAVIEAAGRARLPSVTSGLERAAKTPDVDDRRSIAAVLLGHAGATPRARDVLRSLTNDGDTSVRAEAAFALGAADASVLDVASTLVKGGSVDVATNAAGAIARIAGRDARASGPAGETMSRVVCAMLGDGRPSVRANALAALAAMHRRCGDGHVERKLLAEDASDLVRGNAARAIMSLPTPSSDERASLDRCASSDRSAEVARLCRPRPPTQGTSKPHAVTVFIVGEGANAGAKPRAPFLLQYEDGVLRSGVADRRGAMFDPAAPPGEVTLRRP